MGFLFTAGIPGICKMLLSFHPQTCEWCVGFWIYRWHVISNICFEWLLLLSTTARRSKNWRKKPTGVAWTLFHTVLDYISDILKYVSLPNICTVKRSRLSLYLFNSIFYIGYILHAIKNNTFVYISGGSNKCNSYSLPFMCRPLHFSNIRIFKRLIKKYEAEIGVLCLWNRGKTLENVHIKYQCK